MIGDRHNGLECAVYPLAQDRFALVQLLLLSERISQAGPVAHVGNLGGIEIGKLSFVVLQRCEQARRIVGEIV